jgi:hypothetical protein
MITLKNAGDAGIDYMTMTVEYHDYSDTFEFCMVDKQDILLNREQIQFLINQLQAALNGDTTTKPVPMFSGSLV